MTGFDYFMGALGLAVLAFQVWVSVRVVRSDLYERQQKIWQMQIIWLLPGLGAGLALYMLGDEKQKSRPKQSSPSP